MDLSIDVGKIESGFSNLLKPYKPVEFVVPISITQLNQLAESFMGQKVRIKTISNEIFTGVLITSQNESFIKMDTIIGTIGIEKGKISSLVPIKKK